MSELADAATIERLARWLGELTGVAQEAEQLRLRVPGGGGWSNDTWIVERHGRPQPIAVVRLQPQRRSMFPDYDLSRQADVLAALASQATVPTPPLLGVDLDGAVLGRPAFVMGFVAGRAPSDDKPSFVEGGWLYDATVDQQGHFHRSLLRSIVAVHAIDPDTLGLGWLTSSPAGPLADALERVERIWAFDGGPIASPVTERAIAAVGAGLAQAVGATASASTLLWGDARPANVLCAHDGFDIIALLDWELAGVGPPELDVAWLLEMNWMRAQGAGLAPLAGFLDDDAAVAFYETASGTRLAPLGWYRLFSALRVSVFMHRYLRAMVHAGRMPAEHRIFADNVSTRRLASLLAEG